MILVAKRITKYHYNLLGLERRRTKFVRTLIGLNRNKVNKTQMQFEVSIDVLI